MLRKPLFGIILFFSFVSVFSNISINLPCKNVTVRSGPTAVFNGATLFGHPGQPLLPVYTCAVLLPPDADLNTVTFSIKGLKEEVVGNFTVEPAQPPRSIKGPLWPVSRNIVDGKDIGVYSQNRVFPAEHVEVASLGRLNCYKVAAVTVNLARYNPVTKELLQVKDGELVVDVKKEPNYSRSSNRSLKIPVSTKKRVKAYVVNYDEFAGAYEADFTFINRSKTVIITTAAIQSASTKMDAFITSKAARGIDAEVVTESAWGGTASSLRSWLQANYQTMGIEYAILIGHYQDDVPMMNFPDYSGSSSCESDWPFAQLDGDFKDDKTCEVHSGRIPVYNNSISDLDAILTKTIAFESVGPEDILWRKNALLLGPGYNSGSNMACVPLNAAHDAFVVTTPGWTSYRMYGDQWGSPTGDFDENVGSGSSAIQKIVAKWAEGPFGVIDWATHGSPTSAQDVLSSSYTSQLANDYPGFVFCGSCSNAAPSNDNNLSYSLLLDCSMGAIGGTDLTYYGGSYETSGSDNAWAYHFARCFVADSMTAGEALTSLREMAPDSYGWNNRAPYVLYGDPTVGVYTCNREPFLAVSSPNGGEEWEQGTTQNIAWADNIDGNVKIELFKGGSLKEELAASTESDGSFEWQIAGDYEAGDDYKVKITSVDSTVLNDESDDNFSITEEYVIVCPYFQNFDTLETNKTILPKKWEQLKDDLDWIVWTGKTPSKEPDQGAATGPDGDHTTTSANYIYVESSSPNYPDKTADFATAKFDFKSLTDPELIFWCHMFSDNEGVDEMGDLYLDICVDGNWSNDVVNLTNDHGDVWFEQTVDLNPYKGDRVIFRFRAITGSGFASDICIDDFEINGQTPIGNNSLESPLSFDLKLHGSQLKLQLPDNKDKLHHISLNLYNLQGKLINTLLSGNVKSGVHSISLDKVFHGGRKLATGLYLCKMEAGEFTKTINLLLRK